MTLASTAPDLAALESLLRTWVHDHLTKGTAAFPGSGQQRLTAEQSGIKRPKREVEMLRREREIFKKAAALEAKETR